MCCVVFFFFVKVKTAYEMRISDWSSDVCSSDLGRWGFSDTEMERFIIDRVEEQKKYGVAHRAMLAELCRERGLAIASHDDACPAHVEEAVADGAVIAEFPPTNEAARAARAAGLSILLGAPTIDLDGSPSGNVSAAHLPDADRLDVTS